VVVKSPGTDFFSPQNSHNIVLLH